MPLTIPLSVIAVHFAVMELSGAVEQDGVVAETDKTQLDPSSAARFTVQLAVAVFETVLFGVLDGKDRLVGEIENAETLPTMGAIFSRPNGLLIKTGGASTSPVDRITGSSTFIRRMFLFRERS